MKMDPAGTNYSGTVWKRSPLFLFPRGSPCRSGGVLPQPPPPVQIPSQPCWPRVPQGCNTGRHLATREHVSSTGKQMAPPFPHHLSSFPSPCFSRPVRCSCFQGGRTPASSLSLFQSSPRLCPAQLPQSACCRDGTRISSRIRTRVRSRTSISARG